MAGMRTATLVAVLVASVAAATGGAQGTPKPSTVDVHLLAINDFHGALESPTGANGRIAGVDAGGVEYLAAQLARLQASEANTIVVSGGDNIGGSPLLSNLSHDEASIEALNDVGLQVSTVGNHELDKGWWELLRIQRGGCHPVDGCQDQTPFAGAAFSYLSANIVLDPKAADPKMLALAHITGTRPRALFPASRVMRVGGVRVGFIGLILTDAPRIISPTSTRGLRFLPEAATANAEARRLRAQGINTIVVLTHDGGEPSGNDLDGCGLSQDFVKIVDAMSTDIDVVASAHTHRAYNCTIGGKLVTSASSNGRVITDISLSIRSSDDRVVAKVAHNIAVTRDVPRDEKETALIARYRPISEKIGQRVVGHITAVLPARPNASGESPMGEVIADAMLEAGARAEGGRAEIAIYNNGGIRADVTPSGGQSPAPVTYAQLFDVEPFADFVMVKSVSGEALLRALEQERVQVSNGFTLTYVPTRPPGQRITAASLNGMPIQLDRMYRLATTDFLWDTMPALAGGADPVTVGTDVDVLVDYFMRHSPLAPPMVGRLH
jgi:5'-nucleotidase